MPLFINRDQIFAHQVHLLEHKLRVSEATLRQAVNCYLLASPGDTGNCFTPLVFPVDKVYIHAECLYLNPLLVLTQGPVYLSPVNVVYQSKEERILELETENALLHLRLAEVTNQTGCVEHHVLGVGSMTKI